VQSLPVSPLAPFLERQGVALLDGGLATALEARGHDLADPLWSARVLLEEPRAVSDVHAAYLAAGADCITTATYQATFEGFGRRGLAHAEAAEVLLRGVELAIGARDTFWAEPTLRAGRLRPLVAASIGPYGAFLADGSEYTGRYDLDVDGLEAFHAPRWALLASSHADLLACETIPSLAEARALLTLLDRTPGRSAWLSFQCRDDAHLADGTPFEEAARLCMACPGVAAVGVNCLPPQHVSSLLDRARSQGPKMLAAYPNSGEAWDPVRRFWRGPASRTDAAALAAEWRNRGAGLIGGCCRIGPDEIARMRHALLGSP
jgi:homocysteine S-methyltransferase